MKKLNKLVVLSIGLLLFTVSCDKTTENEVVTLLTKITWQYDGETDGIATLEYDSQNRLVKIIESYSEEGMDYEDESQITYNSEGKISQILYVEDGMEDDKTVYTWTATSVTEVDWYKEGSTWVEDDYKYVYTLNSEGQIIKEQSFNNQVNGWVSYWYDLYTWENGNNSKRESWGIDTRKKSVFKHLNNRHQIQLTTTSLKAANDTKYGTTSYLYDTKNNAFLSVGFIAGVEGYNKNNVTKETYSWTGQADEINMYSYEYNDNNFPTKVSSTYSYDGATETEVTLFEYITR